MWVRYPGIIGFNADDSWTLRVGSPVDSQHYIHIWYMLFAFNLYLLPRVGASEYLAIGTVHSLIRTLCSRLLQNDRIAVTGGHSCYGYSIVCVQHGNSLLARSTAILRCCISVSELQSLPSRNLRETIRKGARSPWITAE